MSSNTQSIYLDYAAATPLDPSVLQKMQPFFADDFYNPSATYTKGIEARKALDAARSLVAQQLGVRSSEIIFTAGGSEANNLAIHGIMRQYPESHIAFSAVEHESVVAPAQRYSHSEIAVDTKGMVSVQSLVQSVTEKTVLVSIMHANNEVGTIQPLKDIDVYVKKIRQQRLREGNSLPIYFHTDACQSGNYLGLHADRLGVDLLSINGSKLYGPKQTGALYVKGGVVLQPVIDGGGQERSLRSGTENVPGVIGFAAALEMAQNMKNKELKRLQELQKLCMEELETALPNIVINGSRKHRLPNNIHITLPGLDNERLLIQLDEAGIMAAAGSACSASSDEPSHVLKAMGVSDADAQASLRFTLGRQSTEEDIRRTVATLTAIVTQS
ncbi:MAG: cysteine desulfurase family protein [Patescibacteria group bacterium]|nr:cysteine desulfurase family protein [Patescibacteria group bacterium]